jgi:hypothetical protein
MPRAVPSLIAALGDDVIVSHHERTRGRSFAYMLTGHGLDRTPAATLRYWARALRALRGEARRVFRASQVIMSIGLDDEQSTSATTVRLAPEEVLVLARLGVGIEVVVYRAAALKRAATKRSRPQATTTRKVR